MQRPKSTDRSSPSLAKRIKVERMTEDLPVKIRHDRHKLKFLEGLGLVTVGRKKGNNNNIIMILLFELCVRESDGRLTQH